MPCWRLADVVLLPGGRKLIWCWKLMLIWCCCLVVETGSWCWFWCCCLVVETGSWFGAAAWWWKLEADADLVLQIVGWISGAGCRSLEQSSGSLGGCPGTTEVCCSPCFTGFADLLVAFPGWISGYGVDMIHGKCKFDWKWCSHDIKANGCPRGAFLALFDGRFLHSKPGKCPPYLISSGFCMYFFVENLSKMHLTWKDLSNNSLGMSGCDLHGKQSIWVNQLFLCWSDWWNYKFKLEIWWLSLKILDIMPRKRSVSTVSCSISRGHWAFTLVCFFVKRLFVGDVWILHRGVVNQLFLSLCQMVQCEFSCLV